jgi:hypothetical protein
MPLPDPHASEMTVELDQDKFKLLEEAKAQVQAWMKHYNRLKEELIEAMGDATAGTVDGEKVVYYRPKDQYAVSSLERDYPDLVEHFKKMTFKEVVDVEAFGAQHPEILTKYRVRAFVERAM